MDEPIASVGLYAQFCVFRAASAAGVKVLLDGQGADELLGGYKRYISARVASLVRRGDLRGVAKLIRGARRDGTPATRVLLQTLDFLAPPSAHGPMRRLGGRDLIPRWVQAEWFSSRGLNLAPFHSTKACEVLRDQLIKDLEVYSIPNLLRYEDRNSMAWSVESRVPFLLPEIAEFCLSLPEEYLVDERGQTKAVFRAAMRGLVPDPILDRQDKIGFAPPADDWMRESSDYVSRELRDTVLERLPFVRKERIRAMATSADESSPVGDDAWRLIFLSQWAGENDIEFD